MPTIALGDDGTMDTVIVCLECGEEFRFNFSNEMDTEPDEKVDSIEAYDTFVEECIEEIEAEHECEG